MRWEKNGDLVGNEVGVGNNSTPCGRRGQHTLRKKSSKKCKKVALTLCK